MAFPLNFLCLVGYLTSDWGGPTTSMLKLSVEDGDDGSLLKVSNVLLGNVTESWASRAEEGWKSLFGEVLKGLAENI